MGKFNKANLFAEFRSYGVGLGKQKGSVGRVKRKSNQDHNDGLDNILPRFIGSTTHIFSGVNRPNLTEYPPYPPETQQRMRELYGNLKSTPSGNLINQKIKRSDKLSLRERWELAKQQLGDEGDGYKNPPAS